VLFCHDGSDGSRTELAAAVEFPARRSEGAVDDDPRMRDHLGMPEFPGDSFRGVSKTSDGP
jgi:hypothetical protein